MAALRNRLSPCTLEVGVFSPVEDIAGSLSFSCVHTLHVIGVH